MSIAIKIFSKNPNSIKKFLKLLIKIFKKYKINSITNYSSIKTKKKFFTILKSPHVNKTAQEQFQFNTTIKKIKFNSFKLNKFLIILKKIKHSIFPDIYIKIRLNITTLNKFKLLKKILNSKKYKLKNKKNINKQLKILQLHGLLKLKHQFR